MGSSTNIDGIHRSSLDEAAPNVLFIPDLWLAIPFLITINEDKWQSLTDSQREAFAEAAEARFSEVWSNTIDEISSAQREAGMTVTIAGDDAVETFANLPEVQANQELWAEEARCRDRGS